jgi:hypothetical protein
MKLTKFHEFWALARVIAVTIAMVVLMALAIKAHGFNLEVEYTGPGSAAERLNEATRDKENQEASDRVRDGSRDPKDIEKAIEYDRENSA